MNNSEAKKSNREKLNLNAILPQFMNKGRDSITPDIEVNPGESEFNKIATSDEDYDLDNDFDVIEDWAEDEKQESTKK